MTPKEIRLKYGVNKTAKKIEADARVFVKTMPFDPAHEGKIETKSWIVISGGKIHRSNTYNGNLGKNGNPTAAYNTEDASGLDEKGLAKKVKGYVEVDATECPFVEVE